MGHENPIEPVDGVLATDLSDETWLETAFEGDFNKIRGRLQNELSALYRKWSRRLQGYTVLVYYSEERLNTEDAERIYTALRGVKSPQRKDVLLVLVTDGGYVVPAYQIIKLCREWAKDKFVDAVTRQA